METILANVSGKVRRVYADGKEWYVAPLALIVPGVLNGSKGALYYPPEEIRDNPAKWNDIPLTLYHPFDALGNPVSASHPGVAEKQYIGVVKNASAHDKLRADGWFDVERLQKMAPQVLRNLERGQPIELSTGLYTQNEPANGVDAKGRHYDYIAREYAADHVAVLPDQQGACSIKDGCGVLVNANPEGCNQYKGCETGGGAEGHSKAAYAAAKAANAKTQKAEYLPYGIKERADRALAASKEAAEATKSGDKEKAVEAHTHASALHGALQFTLSKNGFDKEARAHDKAADSHSAAIDAHQGINRNMLMNREAPTINPAWVEDEDIWEKAKAAADKSGGGDDYYAVVTAIYKKMGGGIKGNTHNHEFSSDAERKAAFAAMDESSGGDGGSKGGSDVHPVAKKHLDAIMSRPHPPQNAGQAEEQGKNEYFNRDELRKTFKNHKEAGKAIRKAFEARGTHNRGSYDPTEERPLDKGHYPEKCQHCGSPTGVNPSTGKCIDCGRQNTMTSNKWNILTKLVGLLGINKDADKPSEIDPTAPAKGVGKGNWGLVSRKGRAEDLTKSAEDASGAALENPSGHEAALKVHQDALYAHIAAYEEARSPSATKGSPDYSAAGYHKNQADYHEAKIRYHGAQALMHKNKVERGEAVATNAHDDEDEDDETDNAKWSTKADAKPARPIKAARPDPTTKPTKQPKQPKQPKPAAATPTPSSTGSSPSTGETANDSYGYSGSINCDMGPRNMLYNDAGEASTSAGMASMQTGHDDGMSHSIAAIGHSKDKDGKKASKSHLDAAKSHEDEALRLRRDGYHDRAHEHDTAAAAHRKAASMHAATHNSEETMNREAILRNLGQKGCFCQESLTALNNLTDRELVVLNASMGKKPGPDLDFQEGESEDDIETGDDDHSFDGKPKKTKGMQAGGAGTPDEYNTNRSATMNLNQLPREFQEDIRYAREMKNRERNLLLDHLTTNAASDEARQKMRSIYAKMGLTELRDLAAAMPAPAENNPIPNSHVLPMYFGAAAPTGNAQSTGPREVEDHRPTINYEELAAPGLLAHLGKTRSA